MNIFIVTFTNDLASMTIKDSLESFFEKTNKEFDSYPVTKLLMQNNLFLLTTDKESIYYEDLDKSIEEQLNIKPHLIIFATKHQSASGIHSLSCHAPGNWAKAKYGGKDEEVCISSPKLLKEFYIVLKKLNEKEQTNYDVIVECTHHGPLIATPCAFFEIGSNEESWKNKTAGSVISNTLLNVLPNFNFETNEEIAIGIGGLHHSPEFSKRLERNECLISHVCPKYMLNQVSNEAIKQAIERSIPKANLILLDWKGLGKDKDRIINICESLNLPIKKTKDFK